MEYLTAMNPARKRTVRLTVALGAAVVLAGALIYTSFSAASPALTPSQLVHQAQSGRSYRADGHGRRRLGPPLGRHPGLQRRGSLRRHRGPRRLHRHRAGPVPRRARGDRHRAEAGRLLCRRTGLADHQVPVQVQGRAARRPEAELLSGLRRGTSSPPSGARPGEHPGARGRQSLMALLGSACLLLALVVCCTGSARRCTACGADGRSWSTPDGASVYALAAILTVAFAILEIAFLRNDFSFNTVADTSSTTTPIVLPRRRGVVLAGGLAAAVGVAAVDVVEPRAVPDAQADARRRAVRDRDAARLRRRSSCR